MSRYTRQSVGAVTGEACSELAVRPSHERDILAPEASSVHLGGTLWQSCIE